MGRLAWDRLIMAKETARQKIKVLDQDVINFIRSHPLFSRNGTFDEGIYSYILRNNVGMDPRTFEEIVRENLAIKRLNDMLTKDIPADKKDKFLEDWLRRLELTTSLNIDLKEYDKYYK